MFKLTYFALAILVVAASAELQSVRDFRGTYQPTMEVHNAPEGGDHFHIHVYSEFPMNGFSDFNKDLILTTGMGQKRSGCDHDISHYACTNPVQWDLQRCGSNSSQAWNYEFVHQDESSQVDLSLETTLHDIKADCPMQSDNAGGGSILVAIMLQDEQGVNRLAAKVWKLDLVFNSRTLATAVMWAEDISGESLLEISIESELDLMVDLTSDVSRDFYTYFVGETVLVRHNILTTAHYEAFPISAWISPFENPSEAAQYFWDANETVQEDQVVPLNFRYVQERTNMLEIWFCFDAPVDCLDCFIHSLANVELINDGGALVGPHDDRRLGVEAVKAEFAHLNPSAQLTAEADSRRLMDANSLQSETQRFQVLDGSAPTSGDAADASSPAGSASFATTGAGVGVIAGVLVAALFTAKKVRDVQSAKKQAATVAPEPVKTVADMEAANKPPAMESTYVHPHSVKGPPMPPM